MPIALTRGKDKEGVNDVYNVRGAVIYKEISTDEVIMEFYTSEIQDTQNGANET